MTDTELLTQMAKALATREATEAWLAALSAEEIERAWTVCPDARALLRLAAPAVEGKALVRVACACLRFTLERKKGHHRVRNAVKVLEQWAQGAATWTDVEQAKTKATERGEEGDLVDALGAAVACSEDSARAQNVVAALSLALSNEGEVYAAGVVAPPTKTRVAALAQLADVVRGVLPCPHSKNSIPS